MASVRDATRRFLQSGKEAVEGRLEDAKRLGRDFVSDRALQRRLEIMAEIKSEMEDETKDIDERVKSLNDLIDMAALAWGTAADDRPFSIMMTVWRGLCQEWKAVLILREVEKEEEFSPLRGIDLDERRWYVTKYGEIDIIPYGLMILDRSFRDKHVAPAYVAVLQQQTGYTPLLADVGIGEPPKESVEDGK